MRRTHALALLPALAIALLLLPAEAAAARRGWTLLGERTVTDRADRDVIPVTATRGDFRKLQIRVYDRGVQFHSAEVHFANGDTQELALRDVIPAGGASRVIDLAGGDRVIRSVEIRYDAQSLGSRRARVKVFAQR